MQVYTIQTNVVSPCGSRSQSWYQ